MGAMSRRKGDEAEEWRDAVGYWPYQVSNRGRLRRSPDAPKINQVVPGQIINPRYDNRGYPQFAYYRESQRTTVKIHRLVAEAFLGARTPGMQVNHKNGIKTDNSIENLEYVWPIENMNHARCMGLLKPPLRGRDNPQSGANRPRKLTIEKVQEIRRRIAAGEKARDIAPDYGVHEMTIGEVKRREIWAWV